MHESSIEIGALDNKSKVIPLVLGPLLALALYFILPETYISACLLYTSPSPRD